MKTCSEYIEIMLNTNALFHSGEPVVVRISLTLVDMVPLDFFYNVRHRRHYL